MNPEGSEFYAEPAIGTNGGFPDETWDGEWEGDSAGSEGDDVCWNDRLSDPPCDGSCIACGGPIEREYVVTATIQLCIAATDSIGAAIQMKDALNDLIAESGYAQDPLNGAIIECVDEITIDY